MDQCRPCGCKGRRSCLICEEEYGITRPSLLNPDMKNNGFVFCSKCNLAWPGWDVDPYESCPNHIGESVLVSGIYLLQDFITEKEKEIILDGINNEKWDPSQSGRRKQNYGPKCNFKKKKIQKGNFNGFPSYSKFVHDKLRTLSILKNFNIVEQCTLEYDPNRGAHIDPHIDDCWIWGERVVTLNILGDTFLTLSKYCGSKTKYNLDSVQSYPKVLNKKGCFGSCDCSEPFKFNESFQNNKISNITLRVFMPERSLVVLYGSARYEWEHFVLREDIKSQRICLAYREFTPPYLPGGLREIEGAEILNMSKIFW